MADPHRTLLAALALYRASATARGTRRSQWGTGHVFNLGRLAAEGLDQALADAELVSDSRSRDRSIAPDAGIRTSWWGFVRRRCISGVAVDPDFFLSVEATAVILAHEGVHCWAARAGFADEVHEEMFCLTNQVSFFDELRGGIRLEGRIVDVRETNRVFAQCSALEQALRTGRLVDRIASSHPDKFDAAFVLRNHQRWGGLAHRVPQTRGVYLRALLRHPPRAAEWELVLEILESAAEAHAFEQMLSVVAMGHPDTNANATLEGWRWLLQRGARPDARLRAIAAHHGLPT